MPLRLVAIRIQNPPTGAVSLTVKVRNGVTSVSIDTPLRNPLELEIVFPDDGLFLSLSLSLSLSLCLSLCLCLSLSLSHSLTHSVLLSGVETFDIANIRTSVLVKQVN